MRTCSAKKYSKYSKKIILSLSMATGVFSMVWFGYRIYSQEKVEPYSDYAGLGFGSFFTILNLLTICCGRQNNEELFSLSDPLENVIINNHNQEIKYSGNFYTFIPDNSLLLIQEIETIINECDINLKVEENQFVDKTLKVFKSLYTVHQKQTSNYSEAAGKQLKPLFKSFLVSLCSYLDLPTRSNSLQWLKELLDLVQNQLEERGVNYFLSALKTIIETYNEKVSVYNVINQ